MQSSKKIEISQSSLISLKAELSRKQEEVNKAKSQSQPLPRPVSKTKGKSVWSKQNAGVTSRCEKDVEELQEEADAQKKSRSALEKKAKLYEKLSKQSDSLRDDSDRFLVNFSQKSREGISNNEEPEEKYNSDDYDDEPVDPEDDWVEYTDCLGRTRKCLRRDLEYLKSQDDKLAESLGKSSEETNVGSETPTVDPSNQELQSADMKRELLRQKWEEQEQLLREKTDIHYQDVLFDEARAHGVGYYAFSSDEDVRIAQQAALAAQRKETQQQQKAVAEGKERRQRMMQERLKAAKQRQRARLGLPPEEEPEPLEEQEKEAATPTSNEAPQVPEIQPEISKKPTKVRPWDVGKEGVPRVDVMSQEEWVEKKRTQRIDEFAPPMTYKDSEGIDISGTTSKKLKQVQKVKLSTESKRPTPNPAEDTSLPFNTASVVLSSPGTSEIDIPMPAGYEEDFAAMSSQKRGLFFTSVKPTKRKFTETVIAPIINEIEEEDEGRTDSSKTKKGAEIAPPPTFEYYGPSDPLKYKTKVQRSKKEDMEDAVVAGMKFLQQQREEKEKKRNKGLLDIV